jgi:hypothetical protein
LDIDIRKGTWKDTAGRMSNQIYHVLINKRRATIIEDLRTMRGPNYGSDHFLIRTIIRHRISCTYHKKQKHKIIWDINKLKNKDIKKDYQLHVKEKLKVAQRKHDVNEDCINIKK